MEIQEFSNGFDILYNNIMSNAAPGLDVYEKSFFLTKAQDEILRNYFNPKGNKYQEGFDDSQKRQIDFSNLMKSQSITSTIGDNGQINVATINSNEVTIIGVKDSLNATIDFNTLTPGTYALSNITTYTAKITISSKDYILTFDQDISGLTGSIVITAKQIAINKIDSRSQLYLFPTDIMFVVNEALITTSNKLLTVVPLKFSEYSRLMSKPFKRPLKNQAWRLINSMTSSKTVEVVTNIGDTVSIYNIRYVKRPKPIILANLADDYQDISINGISVMTPCELDPILHQEILERAVELAKAAYTGDLKGSVELGQRGE